MTTGVDAHFPANSHYFSMSRKQMKPFTIRKAAQPSRAGAQGGLAAGDLSMDASMNKYATADPNYGPLRTAKEDGLRALDPMDETLLD